MPCIVLLARMALLMLIGTNLSAAAANDVKTANSEIQSFLGEYCVACHNAEDAEGEREFESFALPLRSAGDLITADEIIDAITLGDMPPQDADQPDDDERVRLLRKMREGITASRDQLAGQT
ncbi:MAG: c-type cytochrome domain-containing protein, partial [Planctomycetota bacterium]